jgi:hypothetical protein
VIRTHEVKMATPYAFGQKVAAVVAPNLILPFAGMAAGAGIGALTSKKDRVRNALIGAGLGGGIAGLAEWAAPGLGLGLKYRAEDAVLPKSKRRSIVGVTVGLSERDKARADELTPYIYSRGGNTSGLDLAYPLK